ncbi:reverse transcriptase domain-containing protein [Tanacetum coccineum]
MSVRLADRSFQYPIGIAKNMLVEVGKFTFLVDFVILEMEEDSKVPLILGRPFLHTVDAVIRVKQKQLNLGKKISNALLDKGSEIFYSIKGTILEEKLFAEFDEFIAMTADINSESESDTKEPPFKKIILNTDYKIKTSLKEPPTDLELKPLPDNLEYVFLEEPSFLPVIISSQLSEENKNKLISVIKRH